jgi:hypothetical protein
MCSDCRDDDLAVDDDHGDDQSWTKSEEAEEAEEAARIEPRQLQLL